MPPRLFLNHIASLDWLVALEFGRVDEGQPPECWHGVSAHFGYLRSAPQDDFVGFKVLRFSAFDPDSPDNAAIWSGPRFDAPVLGLANVSAGEIVLAARVLFGGEPTVNRRFFEQAVAAEGETAVDLWLACLEAGDAMAHFGLGCALYEMGRYHEAYRHLRHYAEIAPHQAWNWCWRGKAAEVLGELGEARAAYERAIALEADGGDATDAPALLAALDTPPARLVLWGDDHPELGEQRVEALGDDAAAGITAGARPKGYAHVDPNEDVVAVVRGEHGTLLVCADGHNGATASRLAVEEVLRRLGDEPPPADLDDTALVSIWHAAGETIQRVTGERGHPHPESRTTLLAALIGNGRLQWAAMGDSLLALVDRNGVARRLDTPRHHFVGWPVSPTASLSGSDAAERSWDRTNGSSS